MAATDHIGAVYDQLWTLLLANTWFTTAFKANNRIRLDTNNLMPFKKELMDADVPQFTLGIGEFSDSGFSGKKTFVVYGGGLVANQMWWEEIRQTYEMVIVHQGLKLDPVTAAIANIMQLLRGAGAKLGLSYVRDWGPVTSSQVVTATGTDPAGNPTGQMRFIQTIRIPIRMTFQGNTLPVISE